MMSSRNFVSKFYFHPNVKIKWHKKKKILRYTPVTLDLHRTGFRKILDKDQILLSFVVVIVVIVSRGYNEASFSVLLALTSSADR
ncbi:hypothetical protein V1477_008635 [Vespula maculifrons]|uniref:Uncharacterized protein n=1 Tax=Vespula maculifrons TaxID=7453 RepID=A0ABD2CDL7_VESMC